MYSHELKILRAKTSGHKAYGDRLAVGNGLKKYLINKNHPIPGNVFNAFQKDTRVLNTGTLESISARRVKGFTSKIVAKLFQVQDPLPPQKKTQREREREREKSRL